jgi:hypothetical protein
MEKATYRLDGLPFWWFSDYIGVQNVAKESTLEFSRSGGLFLLDIADPP